VINAVKWAVNWRGLGRSVFLRNMFWELAYHFTPAVSARVGRGIYYLNPRDIYVSKYAFQWGGFADFHTLRWLVPTLQRYGQWRVQPGLFLDIGANIGTACIAAITDYGFKQAIAFEPDPMNYHLLTVNIAANKLSQAVAAHPIAVSDHDAPVSLRLDRQNFGNSRVTTVAAQQRAHLVVEGASLDSLMARGLGRVFKRAL
jgi:FkbM family methyltransferase